MKVSILGGLAALLMAGAAGLSLAAEDAAKKEEIAVGDQPGNKIPQFAAKLQTVGEKDAKASDFDSHKAGKPYVLLTVGVKCGATPAYIDRWKALEKEFSAKGVPFIFVYPNKTETDEEKIAFHKEKKFSSALFLDAGGKVAKSLGCKNSAEAFLVDKNGVIQFRGGIDDSARDEKAVKTKYLANAIEAVLAGKKVETQSAKVFG